MSTVHSEITIESIQSRIQAFIQERDYEKFHIPKNVVMSLFTEVGELAEHFIYPKGSLSQSGVEELADVFNNLAELSSRLIVILPSPQSIPKSELSQPQLLAQLVHRVSQISEHFIWLNEIESHKVMESDKKTSVQTAVLQSFTSLVQLSKAFNVDILRESLAKLEKNERKYPLDHAKGNRVKGLDNSRL